MKRLFVLILGVLMIFVASCAQQNIEEFAPNYLDYNSENVDFGGYEYVHVQWAISADGYFGYALDTYFHDIALQRVSDVEKELNCEIICIPNGGNVLSIATINKAVGQKYGDMYLSDHGPMWEMAYNGNLLDLELVSDVIDLSDYEKWGGINIYEQCMMKGKIYTFAANYWPMMYTHFYHALVYNGDLINKFGMQDPRELVENGEWSREKFYEYIETCSSEEPKIYGIATTGLAMIHMALEGNNAGPVSKNEVTGKYEYSLRAPEALDAIEWVNNLCNDLSTKITNPFLSTHNWGYENEVFCNGEATFLMYPLWGVIGQTNVGSTVNLKMENYGWVPFPNGNNRDYGDWGAYLEGDLTIHGIGSMTDDPNATALIASRLYEPFEGYESEELRKEWYERFLFSDVRDYNIFMEQVENSKYNFFKEFYNMLGISPWGRLSGAIQSRNHIQVIEEMADAIQGLINDVISVNLEALAEYELQFEAARAARGQ